MRDREEEREGGGLTLTSAFLLSKLLAAAIGNNSRDTQVRDSGRTGDQRDPKGVSVSTCSPVGFLVEDG